MRDDDDDDNDDICMGAYKQEKATCLHYMQSMYINSVNIVVL